MQRSNEELCGLIAKARSTPIRVLAADAWGREHTCTVIECYRKEYRYICIVADDLDDLLDKTLNKID